VKFVVKKKKRKETNYETRDLEDGDSGADKHPHRIGYFDWRDELHVSSYELILNDNLDNFEQLRQHFLFKLPLQQFIK